ncbi:Pimeloyl-ACP methyl ester carboxylesterase [Chitinophaga costaii]|uniref:Pimeloyl-ACP methyl ester carboxylesterase n=1 Tax=Chitinophaga costaii TaxID=1335309 RepID=A0A1C4ABY6_9BACT|nr:alpha/beta hydrolase [Chitinophaga costaii]PUZ26547.1 alpha/beta hydrolase [Chitinophaga costaii]SCB92152.1 Pimeloyl-ACP methyl ester carboxylesterase [Chitinophaga costaii]
MRPFFSFLLACLLFYISPLLAQQVTPNDATLSQYTYPFPVQYFNLSLQGNSLHMAYMDVTPAQPNGQTIVLLHGKNFGGSYWDSTATYLSREGYRVIVPDQIGFGKSDKPAHLQFSLQLLAQNTHRLLDSLGIHQAIILGHSMGGMLAMRFSIMYPETVRKLILEDPIGLEDWKLKAPYADVDKLYAGELQQNYEKIKKYQLDNYFHGQWKPAYDKWAALQSSQTLSPDYPQVAWNNALTSDMLFTQPVIYELEKIQAPTLLIVGTLDRTALGKDRVSPEVRATMGLYPALGKAAAQRIPHAQLELIHQVGHAPHIEVFSQFIKIVNAFLIK